ncbi:MULTISPECIES: M64 family metallopeptidase [unclassified Carboxylicivirga]|uniref:M64 family metallopeptidase n=1 Tax=Carboxylicivirga TaxID=1628153 RepID=UPI003D32C4B0
MRTLALSLFVLLTLTTCMRAQTLFEQYFDRGSMRVDFVLAGNADEQSAYLLELRKEPYWGGAHHNLIDSLGYGEYRFSLKDKDSGRKLYSRGFCTLFEEWRTTAEAQSLNKAFYQSLTFPYPKAEVTFCLEERKKDGSYQPLMSMDIDPSDTNIRKERVQHYEVVKVVDNGDETTHVDLVFVAEGYTLAEMATFKADVAEMADYILSQSPYKEHRDKFNFWAVCSPSLDAGTDNPRKDEWAKTAVNASFNTFYIDRYLETNDVLSIRDIAACAPYDHVCVLVNSDKYGGGGIYNHFSIGTAHHALSKEVMLHEIGHGFAGLADEYYTSDVAYQNFFDLKVEPWQPNITTMVNFEAKWKHLLAENTPIPTPTNEAYANVTGVFEGGGYVAKGVYRPAINCRMKSNEASGFCEACQAAITRMIYFLTDRNE